MPRQIVYKAIKQIAFEPGQLEAVQVYCADRGGLPLTVGIRDLLRRGIEAQEAEDRRLEGSQP
jgi:hypothetical protein